LDTRTIYIYRVWGVYGLRPL